MKFYESIYTNLCKIGKERKKNYGPGSGLHEHHIIPSHVGGEDSDKNYTYLKPREHEIAHFLLWKVHKNPNDLRSMQMLGARLSVDHRRIVGRFCRDNAIGWFGMTKEAKREARLKGVATQIKCESGFFDPIRRKDWASMGGKASFASPNSTFRYWTTTEGRRERARMGAKAITGRKCMYRLGDSSFIRVKTEHIQSYLEDGYVLGSPLKPMLGKSKESHRRKKVTDGTETFHSLKEAAEKYNTTSSSICNWLKSKKDSWSYVVS